MRINQCFSHGETVLGLPISSLAEATGLNKQVVFYAAAVALQQAVQIIVAKAMAGIVLTANWISLARV